MTDRLGNEPTIRPFDFAHDLAGVKRIWREVGWVDADNEKVLEHFFACGDTLVATMNGTAECSVHVVDGTLRLQETDLDLCAVTAVTTSRIARGHAFAKRLTAQQLCTSAEQGAAVAALGIFDQGFYDLLGFGSGGYDHEFTFDPANLLVTEKVPSPTRLGVDDFAQMHAAMSQRHRVHGSVVLNPPVLMRAELGFSSDKGFGLGYFEQDRLTHFVWLSAEGERGPYAVSWMAYRDTNELLQLLGLLKSLSDQVYSVRMMEPPEIQLQSLLLRPFRNQELTKNSKHAAGHRSFAWWQLRVLDVPKCFTALAGVGKPVHVQLLVSDPLDNLLPAEHSWRGVAGSYKVTIGESSSAVAGEDQSLPVLRCSVNALTRMLWGVAPPSSLAITDDFSADAEVLARLDAAIWLPTPHTGWDF